MISAVIGALLSPVGLVVGGIVLLIFLTIKFWDEIRPVLVKTINYFIDLYNESTLFRGVIQYSITSFKNLWTIVKAVFGGLIDYLKSVGEFWVAVFTFDYQGIKAAIKNGLGVVTDIIDETIDGVKDNFEDAIENTFTPKEKIEFVTEEGLQKGIDNITEPVKNAWKKLTGMFTFSGGTPKNPKDPKDPKDKDPKDPDPNGTTEKKLTKLAVAWKQYSVQVQANAEQAAGAITGMVDTIIHEGLMKLGEALVTGKFDFKSFSTFILNAFANTAEQLGKLAISIGFAAKGIFEALKGKPELAILAGGALLVLAGVARAQMAKMAENQQQVELAKGGLAFGETLAVVGDNPNARMDPEVIAPLSKLQGMLGKSNGGAVEVYGRISGQDILLSSEKAGRVRTRYRGF